MPDNCDYASEMEAALRDNAIVYAIRSLDTAGPDWVEGVPCCRICGEPIPQRRLDALPGVGICVDCAAENER